MAGPRSREDACMTSPKATGAKSDPGWKLRRSSGRQNSHALDPS
jgi:hypothetical protein